jgi:hypothetical protein
MYALANMGHPSRTKDLGGEILVPQPQQLDRFPKAGPKSQNLRCMPPLHHSDKRELEN